MVRARASACTATGRKARECRLAVLLIWLWACAAASGCGAAQTGDARHAAGLGQPLRAGGAGQGADGGTSPRAGALDLEDDASEDAVDGADGPARARARARLPQLDADRVETCRAWLAIAREVGPRYGIDGVVLVAIAWVESAFVVSARSSAGASGPMQLMPKTARAFGCEAPEEPRCAMVAASRLLERLLDRFDGDWVYALSAYNTGGARAARAFRSGALPPNQWYVERVLAARARLARSGCGPADER